mgnify:CR=1 FL=1
MDYTITLTDTEKKSMEYVCADVKEWITNSAQNRARKKQRKNGFHKEFNWCQIEQPDGVVPIY